MKPVVSRYTKFVQSTKMGLAVIAVLLIGLVLFYPIFRKEDAGVRISFSTTSTKKAPEPTSMKHPQFHGLDKDNQPYTMTATSAAETSPEHISFEEPNGEILLKSMRHLFVKARTGTFDKNAHKLVLKHSVIMSDDQGNVVTTDSIMVDVEHKSAATSEPVFGEGPFGKLKAYGGAMADGINQQILFEGPVFVTLNMDNNHAKPSPEKKP